MIIPHTTFIPHHLRLHLLFFLLLSISSPLSAQGLSPEWQALLEEVGEEGEEDGLDITEDLIASLADIHASPFNINDITYEQLEELPFLSAEQQRDIYEFSRRYRPLQSLEELMLIRSLDPLRRSLLAEFIYLGDAPQKGYKRHSLAYNTLRFGKGEVSSFVNIPFYERKGDVDGYAGYPYKHWLRADYHYSTRLRLGVVASQDAGEPFVFNDGRAGYDFYSFYLTMKNTGRIRNLTVGRYRMSTGLGLILNTNYSFGKSFLLNNIQNPTTRITPHSSRSEANYMQGAGITLKITKKNDVTMFVSWREIDATLDAESGGIATLLSSGYHRTMSEIERRHNASMFSTGANIHYYQGNMQLGVTAVYSRYTLPLTPDVQQIYKRYYPAGQDFANASIDYAYRLQRLMLVGETAIDKKGTVSTINTLSWRLTPSLSLMAIQRYYDYRFQSPLGRSFSEGGSVQDENGVYLGAQWNATGHLSLTAYTDMAYFYWPKYQALGSSLAFDNYLSMNYTHRNSKFNLRLKAKFREKDSDDKGVLIYKDDIRLRLSYQSSYNEWLWRVQGDGSLCSYKETTLGGMISFSGGYKSRKLQVLSSFGYFYTQDYNSRVYSYEPSIPQTFSAPSFFGNGIRATFLASVTLINNLSLCARYGFTVYFDRNTIGSALQMIPANYQNDLALLLRYKF